MIWLTFFLAALAVLFSGQRLTRVADEVAEITGLSRGFIGVILLGFITSLPELASTISAAAFCGAPDLALGNVFGSNAANLAILALLDLVFTGSGKNAHRLDAENLLTAYLAMIIGSLALMGLAAAGGWHLFHIDLFSGAIGGVYYFGLRLLHRFQKNPPATAAGSDDNSPAGKQGRPATTPGRLPTRLKKALLLHSGIIVAAAMTLAASAESIAEITGWGTTFVGNSLLALATSLPEIVVTFSAIRLGSFSMAAGNIFGSNIFNVAIIAITDLVFLQGSLFAAASRSQSLIAAIGLLMTTIYLFAASFEAGRSAPARRRPRGAILVLTIYLFSLYALFSLR